MENMEFYSYHGCYREENIVGNRFLVDMEIETDLQRASQTDMIEDTLNYQYVYDIVSRQMAVKSNLLEHVAKRILDALFAALPGIANAKVKISKMTPPVRGRMEKVSVTLQR